MNAQEIFDKALSGVIAQGNLGTSGNGSCSYRTAEGHACGVGQLIDNTTAKKWDAYNDSSVENIPKDLLEEAGLGDHFSLLRDIQHAHDTAAGYCDDVAPRLLMFLQRMQGVANRHNLQVNSTEEDIRKALK